MQAHAFPFDLKLHKYLNEYQLDLKSRGNHQHSRRYNANSCIQFPMLFLDSLKLISASLFF
jgi:hypothetical protein